MPPSERRRYKIGQVADRTGQSVRRLRYLEQLGLLVPDDVSGGSTRYYSEREIAKVRLIEELAGHGLTFREIASLFTSSDQPKTSPLAAIQARLSALADTLRTRARQQMTLADKLCTLSTHLEGCSPCDRVVGSDSCHSCGRPSQFGEAEPVFKALSSRPQAAGPPSPCMLQGDTPLPTHSPEP